MGVGTELACNIALILFSPVQIYCDRSPLLGIR